MTPKEKAMELIHKYLDADYSDLNIYGALSCTLIAVDELIYSHSQDPTDNQFYWWQEVKQEIKRLCKNAKI